MFVHVCIRMCSVCIYECICMYIMFACLYASIFVRKIKFLLQYLVIVNISLQSSIQSKENLDMLLNSRRRN